MTTKLVEEHGFSILGVEEIVQVDIEVISVR
jgi:hypothetical protein